MKNYSTGKYARSRHRMVAGVCAMIARETGIDVGLVRIITVVATVLTSGAVAVAYIAAWVVLPMEGEHTTVLDDLIGKTKSKVADYQRGQEHRGWTPAEPSPGPAPRPPSTPSAAPTTDPTAKDAKTPGTKKTGTGRPSTKPGASTPKTSQPPKAGSKPAANRPAADGEVFDPYDES